MKNRIKNNLHFQWEMLKEDGKEVVYMDVRPILNFYNKEYVMKRYTVGNIIFRHVFHLDGNSAEYVKELIDNSKIEIDHEETTCGTLYYDDTFNIIVGGKKVGRIEKDGTAYTVYLNDRIHKILMTAPLSIRPTISVKKTVKFPGECAYFAVDAFLKEL